MAREDTHRLQPDPPEGDRATIERELARQDRAAQGKTPDDGQPPEPGRPEDPRGGTGPAEGGA
jgi:hypothetical protein